MPWIAAVVGGIKSNVGMFMSSAAAGSMAEAQEAQAQRDREQAMRIAQPSATDLEVMSRQNQLSMQSVDYQQQQLALAYQQLAAINPVIKQAFQAQSDIMSGNIPGYLSPLQKQLQISAQQDQNRIAAALGSGGLTSSAGAQASATSTQQNAMTMMNAQQQALTTMGQVGSNAVQAQSGVGSAVGGAFGNAANMAGAYENMSNASKQMQLNAMFGSPLAPYRGGQFVGALMRGQSEQSSGNALMGMGMGMMGKGGMSGGGGGGATDNGSVGSWQSGGGTANYGASGSYWSGGKP